MAPPHTRLSLVFRRLLEFSLRLGHLVALPLNVVLGNPDHRLTPGVALLHLLKSLRDLSEGELGLHYRQDLEIVSKQRSIRDMQIYDEEVVRK